MFELNDNESLLLNEMNYTFGQPVLQLFKNFLALLLFKLWTEMRCRDNSGGQVVVQSIYLIQQILRALLDANSGLVLSLYFIGLESIRSSLGFFEE